MPSEIIRKFSLDGSGWGDMFFRLCQHGMFAYVDMLALSKNTKDAGK